MDVLPDAPAVVLVALTLAAALFLVEVALPTFGVAGLTALILGTLAFVAAGEQADSSWPLVLVVAGACLWGVLLGTQRNSRWGQFVAAGLFGVGGVSYGVLAGDPATVVLAVVGAAGLFAGFPPLLRANTRLQGLPHQLGMEALVGRGGTVVSWDDGTGTVRVNGSLWTARSRAALSPGDEVEVVGFDGLTVNVALRRRHRSLASPNP
jgi:membrane-bound serine protease (ClpP class)